jgi:hypothetical protein
VKISGKPKPISREHPEEEAQERDVVYIRRTLALFLGAGVVALAIYAVGTTENQARLLGTSLLIASACVAVGGLLGFLFGIPRTLTEQPSPRPDLADGKSTDAADADNDATRYAVNTNLEQISDWLTKILVGVSLTQLWNLPAFFTDLSIKVSAALGVSANAEALSASLLVYFLVCGFLAGYLLTRVYLAGAFSRADRQWQRRLQRLVNVDFQTDTLSPLAKKWLSDVLAAESQHRLMSIPPDFRRETDDHNALRELRHRSILTVVEGGQFRPDKKLTLTPLARQAANKLRAEVESPRSD